MSVEIPNDAFKILNWCRMITTMSREDYCQYFEDLSTTYKRKLPSISVINTLPEIAVYPWNNNNDDPVRSPVSPHPTPPLTQAVPNIQTESDRNARQRSDTRTVHQNTANVIPQARQRSNDDTDFVAPVTRNVRARLQVDDYTKVKEFLKKYGPVLKWHNQLTGPRFETESYHIYNNNLHDENEELLSQFFIDIKRNLMLAMNSEVSSSIHHYNVGQKLSLLHDRIGENIPRLTGILKEGLNMSLRYVHIYPSWGRICLSTPILHCSLAPIGEKKYLPHSYLKRITYMLERFEDINNTIICFRNSRDSSILLYRSA